MHSDNEQQDEQFEVDMLLYSLLDGEQRPELTKALEARLAGRPDLQQQYAMGVAIHDSLGRELTARTHESPAFTDSDATIQAEEDPPTVPAMTIPPVAQWLSSYPVVGGIMITGCLILVMWIGSLGSDNSLQTASWTNNPHENGNKLNESMVAITDVDTLSDLARINRSAPLMSLFLPSTRHATAPALTLCSGVAWLDHSPASHNGDVDREKGYLLTLPPNSEMNLALGSDSARPNSLNIVELDATGRAIGRLMTYSNQHHDPEDPIWYPLGNFNEINDSDSPRYFLFTASHTNPAEGSHWQLSNYKVGIATDELLTIGWDDSKYGLYESRPPNPTGPPDFDFNDMFMVVRLKPRNRGADPPPQGLHYAPSRTSTIGHRGYAGPHAELHVSDGEIVMINVAPHDYHQGAAFQLIDSAGRVVWRDQTHSGKLRTRLRTDPAFFAITNRSGEDHVYHLQVMHRNENVPGHSEWAPLPPRPPHQRGDWTGIQFEVQDDSRGDALVSGGIRVHIHRYSD